MKKVRKKQTYAARRGVTWVTVTIPPGMDPMEKEKLMADIERWHRSGGVLHVETPGVVVRARMDDGSVRVLAGHEASPSSPRADAFEKALNRIECEQTNLWNTAIALGRDQRNWNRRIWIATWATSVGILTAIALLALRLGMGV